MGTSLIEEVPAEINWNFSIESYLLNIFNFGFDDRESRACYMPPKIMAAVNKFRRKVRNFPERFSKMLIWDTGFLITNWGKGYGKVGVRLGIDIAFRNLKLNRLETGIEPKNLRSIALAKTIGMEREGYSEKRLYLRGQWLDMVIFVARSEDFGIEWKPQKQKKRARF